MTDKIKIPMFTSKNLKPRQTKKAPVVLVQRKTSNGKRYLEAPGPNEMQRPYVWTGQIGD